jgi:Cu/Ag efflux protein CusF
MKMKTVLRWSAGLFASATLAALAGTAAADQSAASPAKEKQFTGKVAYVNNEEHALTVRRPLMQRTFDLGINCAITRWDYSTGSINDLRPGQKVTVGYRDVHGVLAADRVEQVALRYRGIVKVIDPVQRQLVLRHWNRDKTFMLAADCNVILRDQQSTSLASVKPGDHVTVVFESPSGPDVVRQIAQTSLSFTGSLVAIDLPHRTVSTADMFGAKQFSLVNDCSIVIKGRTDAPLMSLRPGQRLTINYDEVNGVNVANRIAPAESAPMAAAAQANR